MMCSKCIIVLMLLGLAEMKMTSSQDYGDALTKCILFFEGQRSGKLPSTQRMTWRKDSALKDGSDIGMDLVGGYYDAGDNVKFNFPMAFTTTMLAWSALEFGRYMGSDWSHTLAALRWGTDYLLKATSVPGTVVAVVGDPVKDHICWERPEDMDTLRTSYIVNQTHPGSEVSAEIAAALAASSLVFKQTKHKKYSALLLERASMVFDFADKYQGSYNPSVGEGACPFYCSFNGYKDELLWGAAWLHEATKDPKYWDYVTKNSNDYLGGTFAEFGWDAKHAGINILLSRSGNNPFVTNADNFVCSILPESPTKFATYSPGGLLFKLPGSSSMQIVTAVSFLLLTYAGNLKTANREVHCGNVVANPSRLIDVAKSQVDYILGKNPLGMSYMVGYSNYFPQRIHHRGSSLPSVDNHPKTFGCHDGNDYLVTGSPNQNELVGALVGGPSVNDKYTDDRMNVSQSEPTTYINAPFVGVLAYFKGAPSSTKTFNPVKNASISMVSSSSPSNIPKNKRSFTQIICPFIILIVSQFLYAN